MPTTDDAARVRVPLREGLLSGALDALDTVRLAGCRCAACGETSLGARDQCPNCGLATSVETIALSASGHLWSFTIIRHRPPGDYKGPTPFVPFGMGLVELPEGVRVLSPIDGDIDVLEIGLPLRFKPTVRHDADRDVVSFTFETLDRNSTDV